MSGLQTLRDKLHRAAVSNEMNHNRYRDFKKMLLDKAESGEFQHVATEKELCEFIGCDSKFLHVALLPWLKAEGLDTKQQGDRYIFYWGD